MSILQTIDNPIRLDIYLDVNDRARGHLYLDDGMTVEHIESNERTLIQYDFYSGQLKGSRQLDGVYEKAKTAKFINGVNIHGLKNAPSDVVDTQTQTPYKFNYDSETETLTLDGNQFAWPIDNGDQI